MIACKSITANNIANLPPELLRKGRFDEIFFVDLPTHREASDHRRLGLYESALRSYGRALECERSHVAAWVGQAQMLVLLGEPRQAEMWTISGLKVFPNNADLLAARAQAVCRLGNHREAMQYNDASIQGEGASAYRWSVRGELMTATKSQTAAHCFDSAEQIDADWLVRTENANIFAARPYSVGEKYPYSSWNSLVSQIGKKLEERQVVVETLNSDA